MRKSHEITHTNAKQPHTLTTHTHTLLVDKDATVATAAVAILPVVATHTLSKPNAGNALALCENRVVASLRVYVSRITTASPSGRIICNRCAAAATAASRLGITRARLRGPLFTKKRPSSLRNWWCPGVGRRGGLLVGWGVEFRGARRALVLVQYPQAAHLHKLVRTLHILVGWSRKYVS